MSHTPVVSAENLAAYLGGRERLDSEALWNELVLPYQDLTAIVR